MTEAEVTNNVNCFLYRRRGKMNENGQTSEGEEDAAAESSESLSQSTEDEPQVSV